jgi:Spy/CpxP family protein refolding chaperone
MNKKSLITVIIVCFLIPATAGDALAQARGGMGQGMGQRGARVRENLATLRLLRLTQALDLTEDQTSRIFPFINKIEKEKLAIQRQMTSDIQELRRVLSAGTVPETEIIPLVGRIKASQGRVKELDAESEAFLEKQLSPLQQGRYVIFQIDFYRMLEQAVADLKPQRGAASGLKK